MIRFILLQNRQGRTRLAKYYVPLEDAEKRKLETDIHRLVVNRDPKVTNFLEVRHPTEQAGRGRRPPRAPSRLARSSGARQSRLAPALALLWRAPLAVAEPRGAQFRTYKVIYRRYAGLFFSMCVDMGDNELVCLETIHLFVEVLDTFFSHVCELDLVWHFHKVYLILDEFILAGEVQETSKKVILERMQELAAMEAADSGFF